MTTENAITPLEILLDAMDGAGTGDMGMSLELQRRDLARFTGTKKKPTWRWDRAKLAEMPYDQLQALYLSIKLANRR